MITAAFLVALTAFVPFEPQSVPPAVASGEEASDEAVASDASLDEAQRLFYNGRYDAADALTLKLCTADLEGSPAARCDRRPLLFEIKRAVSGRGDVAKAFKACERCAGLAVGVQGADAVGTGHRPRAG